MRAHPGTRGRRLAKTRPPPTQTLAGASADPRGRPDKFQARERGTGRLYAARKKPGVRARTRRIDPVDAAIDAHAVRIAQGDAPVDAVAGIEEWLRMMGA